MDWISRRGSPTVDVMTMQMETTSARAEELVAWAAGFGPVLREHAGSP